MPRRIDVKRSFTNITVERKTRDMISYLKYPGEPLYETVYRLAHVYDKSELQASHDMIEEYRNSSQNWKDKYFTLLGQRKHIENMEKYI